MTTDIVTDEIKQRGVLSIMIDEAKCYRKQQLSFCIHYVDQDLSLMKGFYCSKSTSTIVAQTTFLTSF